MSSYGSWLCLQKTILPRIPWRKLARQIKLVVWKLPETQKRWRGHLGPFNIQFMSLRTRQIKYFYSLLLQPAMFSLCKSRWPTQSSKILLDFHCETTVIENLSKLASSIAQKGPNSDYRIISEVQSWMQATILDAPDLHILF